MTDPITELENEIAVAIAHIHLLTTSLEERFNETENPEMQAVAHGLVIRCDQHAAGLLKAFNRVCAEHAELSAFRRLQEVRSHTGTVPQGG